MNVVQQLNQYNEDHVYFNEPIKNNIMSEGKFIRIIYSTPYCVLNGIYLLLQINDVVVDKYYNKFKGTFDIKAHQDIIERVRIIEESILKKINMKYKTPQYKIYEQLKNGIFKVCAESPEVIHGEFLLKISGIWETDNDYGVTYKFMSLNNSLIHPCV